MIVAAGISAQQAAKRSWWGRLLDFGQKWVRRFGLDDTSLSRVVAAVIVFLVPGGLCLWLLWKLARKLKR